MTFEGTFQPLGFNELQVKPEYQRTWHWYKVHTNSSLKLINGDRIQYKNKTYKVMANKDYSNNGFFEYDLIEVYEVFVENTNTYDILKPDYHLILCDIIQKELQLKDGQVFIYNQDYTMPNHSGLFITLSLEGIENV